MSIPLKDLIRNFKSELLIQSSLFQILSDITGCASALAPSFSFNDQSRIYNPLEYLRWSFFAKIVSSF